MTKKAVKFLTVCVVVIICSLMIPNVNIWGNNIVGTGEARGQIDAWCLSSEYNANTDKFEYRCDYKDFEEQCSEEDTFYDSNECNSYAESLNEGSGTLNNWYLCKITATNKYDCFSESTCDGIGTMIKSGLELITCLGEADARNSASGDGETEEWYLCQYNDDNPYCVQRECSTFFGETKIAGSFLSEQDCLQRKGSGGGTGTICNQECVKQTFDNGQCISIFTVPDSMTKIGGTYEFGCEGDNVCVCGKSGTTPGSTGNGDTRCEKCKEDPTKYFCSITGFTNSLSLGSSISDRICNTKKIVDEYCQGKGEVIAPGEPCPEIPACSDKCQSSYYNSMGGMAASSIGSIFGTTSTSTVNYVTYPYSVCSIQDPTTGYSSGTSGMRVTGTHLNTRPFTGKDAGCYNDDEKSAFCWCVILQGTSSALNTISNTASVPGTTEIPNWPGHPDNITNVKKAGVNELLCQYASDATVIFDVKPKIAQAGELVYVNGTVGKISETCKGYERTCSRTTQMGCKKSTPWYSLGMVTTLRCNKCPTGQYWPGGEDYSCLGEKTKANWKVILPIAVILTCSVGQLIPGGSVACGYIAQYMATYGTAAAAAISTACSMSKGGNANINANVKTCKVDSDCGKNAKCTVGFCIPDINVPKDGSKVGGENVAPAAIAAFNIGSAIDNCIGPLNEKSCLSVCAKDYETDVAASPTCIGWVIGQEEKSYACKAGSCQGFPNKEVKINLYSPKGEEIFSDTTVTDANGKIDYNFLAPNEQGDYNVVVSVPGLDASGSSSSSSSTSSGSDSGSGSDSNPDNPDNPDSNIDNPQTPTSGDVIAGSSIFTVIPLSGVYNGNEAVKPLVG